MIPTSMDFGFSTSLFHSPAVSGISPSLMSVTADRLNTQEFSGFIMLFYEGVWFSSIANLLPFHSNVVVAVADSKQLCAI